MTMTSQVPEITELAMNTTSAHSLGKPKLEEMRQEICDLAQDLMRRGGYPLDVVQALIDGMLEFSGKIGEEAIREYSSVIHQLGPNHRPVLWKGEERGDTHGHTS